METERKNYSQWLLTGLLVIGLIYHERETTRLHQQIAQLEQQNGKAIADANNLSNLLPELRSQLTALKDEQRQLATDTQALQAQVTEFKEAAIEHAADFLATDYDQTSQNLTARSTSVGQKLDSLESQISSREQGVTRLQSQATKPAAYSLTPTPIPVQLRETHPSGASAICRDGTYSFSANRRGTCSHHGGVTRWL